MPHEKYAGLPFKIPGKFLARAPVGAETSKIPGVMAKNFDELVSVVKRHGKYKNVAEAEKATRSAVLDKGTGSLFLDFGKFLGKKVLPKNVGDKMDTAVSNMHRKLTDMDMRAGSKVYNKLSNNKGGFRDSLANLFTQIKSVPVKSGKPGSPDKMIQVKTPELLAPYQKTKGAVLPFAGALAISSKLTDVIDPENKQIEGGDMVGNENKNKIMNKISSLYPDKENTILKNGDLNHMDYEKVAELATIASQMLKKASSEYRRLTCENEKLSSENLKLKSELEIKTKFDNAAKLAKLMNEKSIIKKADIDMQTKKILELDNTGYEMLKTAVDNVNIGTNSDGVDTLAFLGGVNDSAIKKTLADSISEGV